MDTLRSVFDSIGREFAVSIFDKAKKLAQNLIGKVSKAGSAIVHGAEELASAVNNEAKKVACSASKKRIPFGWGRPG